MANSNKKFSDILRKVKSPGTLQYTTTASAIAATGGYTECPAPPWDPDGTYRLASTGAKLVIEYLVGGAWLPAPLEAPEKETSKSPPLIGSQGMRTSTRTIMFMDVVGWSKLDSHQIHEYASKALPALAERIDGHEFINTWGDAIVATFESVKTAAENALKIRDFFFGSYPSGGVPVGLSCRISLHLGEVIWCDNPLRGQPDIFGNAVHVAARLEPSTAPGHVFCTRPVAERLSELAGSAPKAWDVGKVSLPKGFGEVDVFSVAGPNEPDPRKHLPAATQQHAPPITRAVSDETARVLLQGWLNKLPVERAGAAIPFTDIESEAKVSADQAFRMISDVVSGTSWSVSALTKDVVILQFSWPLPSVSSSPLRGW